MFAQFSTPVVLLAMVLTIPSIAQDGKSGRDLDPDANSAGPRPSPSVETHLSHTITWKNPQYLEPGTDPENRLAKPFLQHIAGDQIRFWQSPKELKSASAWKTFLPFTAFTGALIAGDSWISEQVPSSPSQIKRSKSISNYTLFSLAGAAGGAYVFGNIRHNDHLSEAGLLSGQAALNSTLVAYAFKGVARRQRPDEPNSMGSFFRSGNSFPSEHAVLAWSVASVMAHEYPGPLTQIAAYGLASAVTLTRVTGRRHFASDVVIGSALGWYLGRQVYRAHHDPELGGSNWGDLVESNSERPRNPANMGSPYVSLDSWVYPALDRLAALGYLKGAHIGMRPWTRMQIAQLLQESDDAIPDDNNPTSDAARSALDRLKSEFVEDGKRLEGAANLGVTLDSVYTRVTNISGPALRDGFHFGQTLVNDYGRSYGEGLSNITGISAHAVAGPFSVYVRGEYEHAPLVPALPSSARQAIQAADSLPSPPPDIALGAANRFGLLEGYVGLQLNDWQLTFGKQELWWGPDQSGPTLFSTNARPIAMLQITRVKPFELPGIFGRLGPIRVQYILGRLAGQQWVYDGNTGFTGSWTRPLGDQPFIGGQKISLKPTANLELGISATTIFAGSGVPFTFHKFVQSMFSGGNGVPGSASDPGDRRGAFDFSYRIPRLRDWLTLYGNTFTDDQVNPWFAWDKTAVVAGLYMPRLPKIPKLDLRIEGLFTDLPSGNPVLDHGFFYSNARYKSGYTNNGNLIGSWIGRQGQGTEAWTNYWFNARNKVQFHFRHQTVSKDFVSGGSLTDVSAKADLWIRSLVNISTAVQWERWNFPAIASTPQTNVTAQVQVTFHPHWTLQ